jgi:hypothetical protein
VLAVLHEQTVHDGDKRLLDVQQSQSMPHRLSRGRCPLTPLLNLVGIASCP